LSNGAKTSSNLPTPGKDREKYGSLEGERKGIQRVLNWLTPGGLVWQLAGGEG
jgi:hypothetical protein